MIFYALKLFTDRLRVPSQPKKNGPQWRVGNEQGDRYENKRKKKERLRTETTTKATTMVIARTRMMTSFFDATTNLVIGCIPGKKGGEGGCLQGQ
jgi:hypothetical protein